MMKYEYSISHVPGKFLFTADTLSRAPSAVDKDKSATLEEETEAFIAAILSAMPATSDCLEQFWEAQAANVISQVINFCQTGWPQKSAVSNMLKPYWIVRDELSVCQQLLLHGDRIVIPSCLQETSYNISTKATREL